MVDVVQLVRASDCGSECRGFEPHPPPQKKVLEFLKNLFWFYVQTRRTAPPEAVRWWDMS